MKHSILSIREISQMWQAAIQGGQPLPMWVLGDLLDDFRLRSPTPEAKLALVREEPAWIESRVQEGDLAYLAAVAETLCREAGLAPPAWTESDRCYLKRPWFAGGLENLKATLLAESPVAFRRRNLFISANALERV